MDQKSKRCWQNFDRISHPFVKITWFGTGVLLSVDPHSDECGSLGFSTVRLSLEKKGGTFLLQGCQQNASEQSKKPGDLGYLRDYTTQLYRGRISHYKVPY